MPPGTGEAFSFPEGKLYLYASASGSTSGSGVGFTQDASLAFQFGWWEGGAPGGKKVHIATGQRVDLTINNLLSDQVLYNLAVSKSAVNANFEALHTALGAKSAQWVLYSGVIDKFEVTQQDGDVFRSNLSMHADSFSAFGQA